MQKDNSRLEVFKSYGLRLTEKLKRNVAEPFDKFIKTTLADVKNAGEYMKNPIIQEQLDIMNKTKFNYELTKIILSTINLSKGELENMIRETVANQNEFIVVNFPITNDLNKLTQNTKKALGNCADFLKKTKDNGIKKLDTVSIQKLFDATFDGIENTQCDNEFLVEVNQKFTFILSNFEGYVEESEEERKQKAQEKEREIDESMTLSTTDTEEKTIPEQFESLMNEVIDYVNEFTKTYDEDLLRYIKKYETEMFYKVCIMINISEEIKMFNMVDLNIPTSYKAIGVPLSPQQQITTAKKYQMQAKTSNKQAKIQLLPIMTKTFLHIKIFLLR